MYICNVATDLYGKKHNVKLRLTATPTYQELVAYVESHFDVAARATRPEGYIDLPFKVQTLKIYDTILLRWVDVYNTAQLTHNCQLYAHQPENTWHTDMQGKLPRPKAVVAWAAAYGNARRTRALREARDSDNPPSRASKLRSVFGDLDIGSKGYVLLSDLKQAMAHLDIKLSEGSVPSLFKKADRSQDGQLDFEEWARFCVDHPSLLDALFFRARPVWNDNTAKLAANEELLALRRQRERELEGVRKRRAAWQQRSAMQKQLESQRKEAELARLQAEIATIKEQAALDELYYCAPPENALAGHFVR
ncbi:calmodulin-like protein containing EF hand domain [Diplonema papillatum]|nr:calmodulin-like protein containing EF hand domain [Diplonema papillatum]